MTPLHFAAQRGHHEVFQLLLKAGAKLDMVTKVSDHNFVNNEVMCIVV